jgi:hypothetical protein
MAVLKKGAKGAAVKDLQVQLNKNGAKPKLAEDGDFGPKTEGAVKAFQKSAKLKPDGAVGEVTMAALKYGGPLPEMTVKDYQSAFEQYRKTFKHNKSIVQDHINLSREIEALAADLGKDVGKAQEIFNENADHWAEVIILSKQLIGKQAEFAKKRLSDPKAAAKLVKDCESLHKQVRTIGEGRIVPNQSRYKALISNSKRMLKNSASSIQQTLADIEKRNAAF